MLDKKGKVIEHFSPKGELVIDEKWDLNKYAKEFNKDIEKLNIGKF